MKTLELLHRIYKINRLLAYSVQNEPKSAVSKRAQKRRAAKATLNGANSQTGKKPVEDNNSAELSRVEGQKKLEALRAEIFTETGAPGVEYLEKIFNSSADTSSEDDILLVRLPKECNAPLFLKLLPLCRLAFLYENNGNPEDHAKKLATLFNNMEEVFQYLIHFGKLTPTEYLLHDACLFELPKPESCHFDYWKEKALQKEANGIRLLNPRFGRLFSYAPEIEKLLSKQSKQEAVEQSKIDEIKEKIRAINKAYKKTEQTPINNPTEEQKNKRREKLSQLSTERSELLLNLAQSCLGLSLEETDILIWEAFYEQYKSHIGDTHKILVTHGISQSNQDLFFKLKPNNDDIKVPNILINGADIGHAGLYLKKLDIMTPEGKAIAACLGKITGCCQFLGGQGHSCVVHGIESSDDGFYVVYRGDADNPQLNDAIVAQAWVWRGRNGMLVFDSIETIRSLSEVEQKKIIDIFRYCALQLCSNPRFEQYAVHQVNTGSASGITHKVADTTHYTALETHSGYRGYSDAKTQFLLGSRDLPYLFYSIPDASTFKDKIDALTHSFLKEIFSSNIPFKDNVNIQNAIQFFISSKSGSFFRILCTYAGDRHQELLALIEINRRYIDALNIGIVDLDRLEQGAYINATDNIGKNGFFVAIKGNDVNTAKKIIALNINIKAIDQNGNNALVFASHLFAENWKEYSIKDWILLLSEKFDLNALVHKEYTPLGLAILQNDIEIVRLLLEKGALIDSVQSHLNKTPIQLAIEKGFIDIVHLLLQKGAKLHSVDSWGNNLLMSAITSDNEFLEEIVLILLKNGINILQENSYHTNVLDDCVEKNRMKYIPLIIDACNEPKDVFQLISSRTWYGNTILHKLVGNTENIYIIELLLNKLFPEEFKQVILLRDKNRLSFIPYTALKDPQIFGLLLRKMMESNEEDLKALLWSKDFINEWLRSNVSTEVYKIMFTVLPKIILKKFIKLCNFGLHHIATDPNLLEIYLSWYASDEEKLEAICAPDRNGCSILLYSVKNVQSFRIILSLYQDDCSHMLSQEPSLLAAAVSYPEVFFEILKSYPNQEAKNAALKSLFQLEESNRFWTEIQNKPEIVQCILAAYTDEEKYNILSQKKIHETIGHICSKPQTLEWFKELLRGLSWHEAFIFLSTTTAFSENHKSLWNTIISAKPLGSGTNLLLRNFPQNTHCDILFQVLTTAPYKNKKLSFLKKNQHLFKNFSAEEHTRFIQGLMKQQEYNAIDAYVKLFATNIQSKINVISDIAPFYQHGVDNFVYPAVENKLFKIARADPNSFKDIIEYLPAKFLCDCIKNNILSIHLDFDTLLRILSHTCKNRDHQILVVDCFSEVFKALSLNDHIAIMNTLSGPAFLHYLEKHYRDIRFMLTTDEDIASLFHSIKDDASHSCGLPSRHDWLYDKLKDQLLPIVSEEATIHLVRSKLNEQRQNEFLQNVVSFVETFKATYTTHRENGSFPFYSFCSFFRSNFQAQLTNNDAFQNFIKIKLHAQQSTDDSRTHECLRIMRK